MRKQPSSLLSQEKLRSPYISNTIKTAFKSHRAENRQDWCSSRIQQNFSGSGRPTRREEEEAVVNNVCTSIGGTAGETGGVRGCEGSWMARSCPLQTAGEDHVWLAWRIGGLSPSPQCMMWQPLFVSHWLSRHVRMPLNVGQGAAF